MHDLAGIPPGGVKYAVVRPVDLTPFRRPCEKGPVTLRVRAILSWGVQPPPDPNFVPVWGNREETRVHVKPGPAVGDERVPFLSSVGDVPEMDIDGSGKASGACIHTGFPALYGKIIHLKITSRSKMKNISVPDIGDQIIHRNITIQINIRDR